MKDSINYKVVILDNGHGENTSGKRSPDGLFREYQWTRMFVKRLKSLLEKEGYIVFDIVPEEQDISLTARANRANAIIAEYGAKSCVFISIHNNAAGNGNNWYKATGWEAFTTIGNTNSDRLAQLLYEEIELQNIKIRKDITDGDYDKECNYTVIFKTNCPAVLTENMFMDSKEDINFLNSEEGIEKLLNGHINGIRRFFEDRNGTHSSWLKIKDNI